MNPYTGFSPMPTMARGPARLQSGSEPTRTEAGHARRHAVLARGARECQLH